MIFEAPQWVAGREQLNAMGVANVRDGGEYSLHMTDPFGYDVQISGLANNALTDF